jgi:hypothetical protein
LLPAALKIAATFGPDPCRDEPLDRWDTEVFDMCGAAGKMVRNLDLLFVPSTALASSGYDGQPAVYLYIAALEVNVLNCRRPGLPDCHGAGRSRV